MNHPQPSSLNIRQERPADLPSIEKLLDESFGADRKSKTTYRLREENEPVHDLCLVALDNNALVGTIRYWPVLIGGVTPALLLGPIAVHPGWHPRGLAAQLINLSLGRARDMGQRIVLLVGDAPYYGRFGFSRATTQGLQLPGPVDADRFLGLELVPGALQGVSGAVQRPVVMEDESIKTPEEKKKTVRK